MCHLPPTIALLISLLKLMHCQFLPGQKILYDIESTDNNLVCPVADRAEHSAIQSKVTCSVVCAHQSGCLTWMYVNGDQLCYTCQIDDLLLMEPFSNAQLGKIKGCTDADSQPLVSGTNAVEDEAMTASSSFAEYRAYAARIHFSGWATPQTDTNQYLQIDFAIHRTVFWVCIKGMYVPPEGPAYTKTYTLLYSHDCINFVPVLDNSENQTIFTGNSDNVELVYAQLPRPTRMRCVRINPQSWQQYPALRIEIYGC